MAATSSSGFRTESVMHSRCTEVPRGAREVLRAQCGEFRIEECRYHTLSAFLARTFGPAALDQASYWPAPVDSGDGGATP